MSATPTEIPGDIVTILARSTIEGNVLTLPAQLDRDTYLRVNKALTAARGKWDRKAKGHVFPFDPRELIASAVDTGTVLDAKKALGFFETPHELATEMVRLAALKPGDTALEPSAGLGRIVAPLVKARASVTAVEIDRANVFALRDAFPGITTYGEAFEDFAAREATLFDAVVMNPPFAAGSDIAHIRAAWGFVRPGGRLVAVICEGPFFREDKASRAFRDWLSGIGAEARKLPDRTFRESGTDVAASLIVAVKPAGPEPEPVAEFAAAVELLPMVQVRPDPDQPRKIFEPNALRELARSIRADGLLQPVTVRRTGPGSYQIVAGERRWRAHELNGAETIRAIVTETADTADIRVKQIIENDQRVDVTPLEQARSYQSLMDESGWTVEQLAARIGKDPWRIRERTVLLTLKSEYQDLLAGGNLTPSQATELARLTPRGQEALFKLIRTGGCKTYNDLRAAATAILQAEAQSSLLAEAPKPTAQERQACSSFEDAVARVASLLRASIRDNQVTAVRKTNPHRAGNLADIIGEMQKDLRRIELALRETAIQADFLAAE